jgi:hypothetical protein
MGPDGPQFTSWKCTLVFRWKNGIVCNPGWWQTNRKETGSQYYEQSRKEFGLTNYFGFSFERHGVFVHKGVGRGYQSNGKGLVIRTAKYPARVRERVAVEWFNPAPDRNIPILADELANINADAAVNATRMRIS